MRLFEIMDTAFENFDATVRSYLQKTFNDLGLNYTHNQIFGVIYDGIKGIMQNIMFYIEDAFTEQNVFTAQRKKSVYSLAKISGYEPFYGAAATGSVFCKLNINNGLNSGTSKIYVENGTTVQNAITNALYTIIMPTNYYIIDVTKPLITHEFKIIQGTWKTSTYSGEGEELETINLYATGNYDTNYITVTVNGKEWTPVSNLYEMTEDSENFIVTTGYDNTLNITFGNGVHGKKIEKGQSIIVKYIVHSGAGGNINNYDNYKLEFFSFGTDTQGNTVDLNDFCTLSINNVISGGTNADSIDIVRKMIGYNSRSNVLASEENFKLFLKRFSFVGQSSIWSEENSSCIVISALTNYYTINKNIEDYFTSDITKFYLDSNQKNMIADTINKSNKAFAGVTIHFQDPIIRRFSMICYVKANTAYNKDAIKENIQNIVANYFINLDTNVQFIAKSDIIKQIVDNDDNIEAVDFQFISELAETTFYKGYYEKYYMQYTNRSYAYSQKRVFYEPDTTPGLDEYGNISLDTKLEIPMLRGGFKYYPNKDMDNKTESINMDAIQIFFI